LTIEVKPTLAVYFIFLLEAKQKEIEQFFKKSLLGWAFLKQDKKYCFYPWDVAVIQEFVNSRFSYGKHKSVAKNFQLIIISFLVLS